MPSDIATDRKNSRYMDSSTRIPRVLSTITSYPSRHEGQILSRRQGLADYLSELSVPRPISGHQCQRSLLLLLEYRALEFIHESMKMVRGSLLLEAPVDIKERT